MDMQFSLRKWRPEDAPNVAKYANNEKIACNLRDGFPYPYSIEDAYDFIEDCLAKGDKHQCCRAIAINDITVGSIGIFIGTDVYSKSGEIGYWLAEEFWNKGIVTKAIKQMCKYAFENYDIVRIHAQAYAPNLASRKVLEKAGFTLEGIMKNGIYKKGKYLDYCMYALLK